MRCGLERMNARRVAPAMVIPWPSGATPPAPIPAPQPEGAKPYGRIVELRLVAVE